jgi:3-deoxy-D-manno-octulosonate 8-phosphate phosphatase (KDO 8-P phosphatase)
MDNKKLQKRFSKIKVLALDCDGVMTPAFIETGVIMDIKNSRRYYKRKYSNIIESARFSHRDGQGIDRIRQGDIGIKVVVITHQRSGYVKARCDKMGVVCLQSKDKLDSLNKWISKEADDISLDEVCFVGDDIGDLNIMKNVGMAVTVADGDKLCKDIAHYTTIRDGGDHAVREICDIIVKAKTSYNE